MIRKPEVVAWAMASEGSFATLSYRSQLQPKVSINNTDEEYIDKFKELVGFGNSGVHTWNARNSKWKPIFHWYITSYKDCLLFCEAIVDYMPIKKQRAKLMIGFCKNGVERVKSRLPFDEYDWEIYEELRLLNRRGL